MLKVLLHIRSLDIGGSERQVISLAKAMADIGVEAHIAVTTRDGQLETEVLGIPNIYLHHIEVKGLRSKFKYLLNLRSLIKSKEFDAVYGFLPVPNLALLIARTLRNRPFIAWGVRSSGIDLTQYSSRVKLAMRVEKYLSRFSDSVITNSQAALKEYRIAGYPNSKLRYIPNAIDTERFKPAPEARVSIRNELNISCNTPLIGLFARIHPMKDHVTFLQAAKILVEKKPDIRFICAGSTSLGYSTFETLVKSTATDLGLDKHIYWLGAREDPEKLMVACDITTLTSDSGEGFPNSIAESIACGVPCVATDIGDSSNIVSDFISVVPPKNPKTLATGWETALNQDPVEQGQTAMKMRQSVIDRFSCSTVVNLIIENLKH
ncbi:MAG: glycosyltransferase [Chloroflexota bacterium]|nr:glycosyltransferase [Chloroflexota bacterium]